MPFEDLDHHCGEGMGAGVCAHRIQSGSREKNVHVHTAQLAVPGTPQPTELHYTQLGLALSPQLVMEKIPSGHTWRSVYRDFRSCQVDDTTPFIHS